MDEEYISSKVWRQGPGSVSLRTTIPRDIVQLLGLIHGDELAWFQTESGVYVKRVQITKKMIELTEEASGLGGPSGTDRAG